MSRCDAMHAFYCNSWREADAEGCVRSCIPATGVMVSHTQVREEGTGEEGMINHAQTPWDPQACLGEYISPPGGSWWEITPTVCFLSSVLIGKYSMTLGMRNSIQFNTCKVMCDPLISCVLNQAHNKCLKTDFEIVEILMTWSTHEHRGSCFSWTNTLSGRWILMTDEKPVASSHTLSTAKHMGPMWSQSCFQ